MYNRLLAFDVWECCPGFPQDDRLRFRQESPCISLLVEHLLRRVRVGTEGIRQVMLQLEQRELPGLIDRGTFQGIIEISWPFDFGPYFAASPHERSALLAASCERAFHALAARCAWNA